MEMMTVGVTAIVLLAIPDPSTPYRWNFISPGITHPRTTGPPV